MKKNVLEWLEDSCGEYCDKVAYRDTENVITFSEILDAAKRIGSGLADLKNKAPVAVISSRCVFTISAYLGIVYSGHAYAPIDVSLPKQRIVKILSSLNPSAIITDENNYSFVNELTSSKNVFTIEELSRCLINESYLKSVRGKMVSTDPLYVIYTSGSTGIPKGVITSHQSLMFYIESYTDVMGICESDILGNQSPLDYIAAIRDIYVPLLTGCSSVIIPKELFMEPNNLFSFMNQYGVTSVGWSVSAFTILLSLGAFEEVKLQNLKKICFSGSVMPASCLQIWQDNLPDALFVNQYGPTEATASCTYYIVDHKVNRDEQLLIGKPYNNYKVFLLNDDLSETPQGEIGEICVSGPILALGYYNDLERTAKSFILNPNNSGYPERMYRTGDYGRLLENGLLEFHGRKDRQIKHMGHRVELDEVEFSVNQVDGVHESVSIYNEIKEIIYLYYTGEVDRKKLLLEIRKTLPGFMVPRKVKKLDYLPKLPNGKIDFNTLKEDMQNDK